MNIVTENPLNTDKLFEKIQKRNSGSVLLHYAVVKNNPGERVSSGIRLERTGDMEAEMSAIEAEIRNRWNIDDVMLVRRIGFLSVGDLISLVAVSAEASADAFEACQHGLSRLKKMKSFKKTENYTD